MNQARTPRLDHLVNTLAAPTTALGEPSGQIRADGAQGVLHCDIRVLSAALLRIDGEEPAAIGTDTRSAGCACFTAVSHHSDGGSPAPAIQVDRTRTVRPGRFHELFTMRSIAGEAVPALVEVEVSVDLARVADIRAGLPGGPAAATEQDPPSWSDPDVRVWISAPGARVDGSGDPTLTLRWQVTVPPNGHLALEWTLTAHAPNAPVTGIVATANQSAPAARADDPRLPALLRTSWSDLTALRTGLRGEPGSVFFSAGSPW